MRIRHAARAPLIGPRAFAALCLVLSSSSCAGPGEPIPGGMRTYLDALVAKDHRRAYDATQLFDLVESFGPGASLSYEHFEAFHRTTPLKSWTVENVTRLDARPIEQADRPGTPYFEVIVTMRFDRRTANETFTVLGEVLPRVQVEPVRLFLQLPAGTTRIRIDGVDTRVRAAKIFDGSTAYPVLVLRGIHSFDVAGRSVRIDVSDVSPKVLSGEAELVREGDGSSIVRLG